MVASDKVFILTGASRGIGLAIAHYLLKQNSRVVVVGRSESPLRELEKQYQDHVAVVVGDFADLSLAKKVTDTAEQRWQRIDGVIVNHGMLDPVAKIADSSPEEWQAAFAVNYFSAVALAQAAISALRKTKGSIVFTSSGAAVKGYQGWGAYGSAKAAINHLTMTLASEEKDIVSLAIRPGVVDTEMQRDIREKHLPAMDKDDATKFAGLKSSGSLLKPEQPGHVIAKLALSPPRDLSGSFISWDAEQLKAYQA